MIDSKAIQARLEGLKKLLEAKRTEIARAVVEAQKLEGSITECSFWAEKAKAEEAAAVVSKPSKRGGK